MEGDQGADGREDPLHADRLVELPYVANGRSAYLLSVRSINELPADVGISGRFPELRMRLRVSSAHPRA